MKNVYDILVNFKKSAYEFYEWNREDNIDHIKVIPSFLVSDECLYDFINYKVKVDKSFLEQIYGKTETFTNHLVKVIDYACILYNDDTCLAAEFNSDGYIIGKSKLLFDEEDDVIISKKNNEQTNINYFVEDKNTLHKSYTRKEVNMVRILNGYLDNIFNKNEVDEIKYMYFECFNLIENDSKKAYEKLRKSVSEVDLNIMKKLKTLIKVLKK